MSKTITMLTSSGCEKCAAVEARLLELAKQIGTPVSIVKIDCLSDYAVNLGIQYGLTDVPSFVVGNVKGFSGDAFKDSDVLEALRR